MEKTRWYNDVIMRLITVNSDMFHDAIEATEEETETVAPSMTTPERLLVWLRGDEPTDMYDAGDDPNEYADFLLEEWDLYGPLGE